MNVTAQTYFDKPAEKAHKQYGELLSAAAKHRTTAAQCREALGVADTGAECVRLMNEAKTATLDGIFSERRALSFLLSDMLPSMRTAHSSAVEKAIAARDEAKAATDKHLAEIGARRGIGTSSDHEKQAEAVWRGLKNESLTFSDRQYKAQERFDALGAEAKAIIDRL